MGRTKRKRVTIADVAAIAKVGKSTVSNVWNSSRTRVPISEETRQRVLRAAKECGYQPNAAARALSTARTGHIGFMLSSSTTGGWSNSYFSQIFTGVEAAASQHGYGLNASLYNLSSIDSFVFPSRIGQRCVDGLIMTGHVDAKVIERFKEFQIPCICIGDDTEVAGLIPTVASDILAGTLKAIRYGAELGHVNIGYCSHPSRRGREVADSILKHIAEDSMLAHCRGMIFDPKSQLDYAVAGQLFEWWVSVPENERATLILTSDQTAIALLGLLNKHGFQCPKDVSIISTCDSDLCKVSYPPLTAMDLNVKRLGEIAVNLLIDHLENHNALTVESSRNDQPTQLIVRDSCCRPIPRIANATA